jgi:hypothetical protein
MQTEDCKLHKPKITDGVKQAVRREPGKELLRPSKASYVLASRRASDYSSNHVDKHNRGCQSLNWRFCWTLIELSLGFSSPNLRRTSKDALTHPWHIDSSKKTNHVVANGEDGNDDSKPARARGRLADSSTPTKYFTT